MSAGLKVTVATEGLKVQQFPQLLNGKLESRRTRGFATCCGAPLPPNRSGTLSAVTAGGGTAKMLRVKMRAFFENPTAASEKIKSQVPFTYDVCCTEVNGGAKVAQ